MLKRLLRVGGQPIQLRRQEIEYVLRVSVSLYERQVPFPRTCRSVEGEAAFVCEFLQKLLGKKRVSGRFLVNHIGQRLDLELALMESVGNQRADVFPLEWPCMDF